MASEGLSSAIGSTTASAWRTLCMTTTVFLIIVFIAMYAGTGSSTSLSSNGGDTTVPVIPPTSGSRPTVSGGVPKVPPSKLAKVWLRGTNGRLAPSSECTPVPSWGYWRARCGAASGDAKRCGAGAAGRSVVLQLATNVTVTRVLCSGAACGSRHPPFVRVPSPTDAEAESASASFAWRVDVGACPRSRSAAEVAASVEGAPATDVYLDIEVVEDEAARAAETCFLTIGDWGKEGAALASVSEAMNRAVEANTAVRFIVSTGDNFYPAGIKSIDDPQIQTAFEKPFNQPLMKQMMWLVSAGNHDQWGMKGQLDFSLTSNHPKRSERWYFPDGTYSLEMPVSARRSMRLVVMDTFGRHPVRMLKFLEAEMVGALNGTKRLSPAIMAARTTAEQQGEALGVPVPQHWQGGAEDWRIVINHAPMYSGSIHGQNRKETEGARALIKPTVDRVKAHMYISGHDHVLEVHRDDKLTDYFVSGGGGGSAIYPSKKLDTTKYYDPSGILGFMQHCFKGDTATTTVYGVKKTTPLFVYTTPLKQQEPTP